MEIVGDDGKTVVIQDYFKADRLAPLVGPDGNTLSGEVVELLAGPRAPGQYAQAGTPAPSGNPPIGTVQQMAGNVTVIRNGVSVDLGVGAQILKSDVIQTGSNTTVAIVLTDGTALNLGANTRMAMNEFAFDPNATNNTSLLTLVQGSFAFVAGQMARTGGLHIDTPVATMGIRGTVGGGACGGGGSCEFYAATDISGQPSTYTLYSGGTFVNGQYVGGTPIGTVTVGTNIIVSPTGLNQPPQLTFVPAANADPLLVSLVQQLVQLYPQMFAPPAPTPPPTTPQSDPSNGGSSTPPDVLDGNQPPQQQTGLPPPSQITVLLPQQTDPSAPPVPITVTFVPPPPSSQPASNRPPVVVSPIGNQASPKDAPWTFTVPPGTFTDPDTPVLVYAATLADGSPLPGWLSFNPATQTFSGQPPQGFSGSVVLRVTASDGTSSTASLFTLTVQPVNGAPSGTDNTVTTNEDTAVIFTAAQFGFSDPDGHSLAAVVITTLPAAGTLTNNGVAVTPGQVISVADINAGNLRFTPAADANGNGYASFTFQVRDNGGTANGGQNTDPTANTMMINVTPVNDDPVAQDDNFAVSENSIESASLFQKRFIGNVLLGSGADSDVEGDSLSVLSITNVSVDEQIFGFLVQPPIARQPVGDEIARYQIRTNYGDAYLAVRADGSVWMWSDFGEDPFRPLGVGQSATISFTYEVSDGNGGTDTANVSIQVNGSNDKPDARNDQFVTNEMAIEGAGVGSEVTIGNVLANDRDVDGDGLTVLSVVGLPWVIGIDAEVTKIGTGPGAYYRIRTSAGDAYVSVGTDGQVRMWSDSGEDPFAALGLGQYATIRFSYTVSDGKGGFDTAQATITVAGNSEAPTIHAPDGGIRYWASNTTGNVTPINRIWFDDPDTDGTVRVTFRMDDSGDKLSATNTFGSGVSVIGSNNAREITLQGTIAAINAYLLAGNLLWDPSGSSNGASGTLTVKIDDNGAAFGGNVVTATVNISEISTPTFPGHDTRDFSGVNFTNVSQVNAGSGNDTITTAWSHDGQATTYDGGTGLDTIHLVFTPDQLAEILANSFYRNELTSYLDNPFGDILNLAGSGWNAIAKGFGAADVSLATGFGTGTISIKSVLPSVPPLDSTPDSGDDLIIGTNGNNNLGSDSTLNGGGNDVIVGLDGNDTLKGGAGNDLLLGGKGNDVLIGGRGNDILSGGAGADTFKFTEMFGNNANFGKDVIVDFEPGVDVIEIDHAIFADFMELVAHMADDGNGNAVITVDANNKITLSGVSTATAIAHQGNFLFT